MTGTDRPRILVIGSGVLGTFVARRIRTWADVVVASRSQPRDAGAHVQIELTDPVSVAGVLGGFDLVVNCVRSPELLPERWILESGGTLLNLANLSAEESASLRADGRSPRGTVVLNAGLTPGVNSLLAADLLARYPQADEVRLVMSFSYSESGGPQAVGGLAYRLLARGVRHRTGVFHLAEPYGSRRCLEVGDAADGLLGRTADGRTGKVYFFFVESWFQRSLLALNSMGLLRLVPRWMFVAGLKVPDELTREKKADLVEVTLDGQVLAGYRCTGIGDYRLTVAAADVFAEALLERTPLSSGVRSLEDVVTFAGVRSRLEEVGFRFEPVPVSEAVTGLSADALSPGPVS